RRYPRVVVASEWFERRSTGWALRAAGALPIDRSDPSTQYAAARRVLDAGIPILVLPEGQLSGDPTDPTSVGVFKTGAARLALHCNSPVWPLAIVGADDVWPIGNRLPRLNPFRRRCVLVLGAEELLTVEGDRRLATEQIRTAVVRLLREAVELRADELAGR
ncbi:MAG: 1-acyl-sn-glycerol-3-phosphate acyltransferase, partial [Acidimicrobiia bacterium]|nr:1-acyl-sn-glycerol-3-phosphate acyltransferase [Acidimicrobiia bacterium]